MPEIHFLDVTNRDGVQTARFTNRDDYRGKPPSRDPLSGYIGLEAESGKVAFRDIRVETI